ncbi:hypothetical protein GCM10027425_20060 [Alteromonas gracilis]
MTGVRRAAALGAVALAALAGGGVVAAPAQAAQTAPCVRQLPGLDPLEESVSQAQRLLDYTDLWSISTGAGVTVAVIDTGVAEGPAFGDRLRGGGDLVDPRNGRDGLVDCDGHGTVVAGLIAGRADLETGFAGVAPDAELISIRQTSLYYDSETSGSGEGVGTADSLADAVDRAVSQGADVINISGASCGSAFTQESTRLRRAVDQAVARDVVVVVAAGNLGGEGCETQNTPGAPPVTRAIPADVESALTVGAVDAAGMPAEFSLAGPWVDVAAPGSEIISVNPQSRGGQVGQLMSPEGANLIEGTSFAAPYVAGVAALVRSRFPELSAEEVVDRILATANRVGGEEDRDDRVGVGLVNPRAALTAVLPEEGQVDAEAAPAALPQFPSDEVSSRDRLIALGAGVLVPGLLLGVWVNRRTAERRRELSRSR